MAFKRILTSACVLLTMGALILANAKQQESTGSTMLQAVNPFLNSLTEEQRQQATFDYNDAERLNWHFIPRERKGLPLRVLEGAALKSAHRLIASGLSNVGYDQAVNVMSLEEVLFLLEGGEREIRREKRDPQKYYLSIFGKPESRGTWGWRVEGHHLSLNYTIIDNQLVASTPEFFGANPGTIDAGLGRQWSHC